MHSGHRERMKNKILKGKIDSLEEHEILECLLYYSIPRKDTNPIAHELINKYKNLSNVIKAPVDDLKKVNGIGDETATLLKMVESSIDLFLKEERIKSLPSPKEDIELRINKKMETVNHDVILLTLFTHNYRITYNDFISSKDILEFDEYEQEIVNTSRYYKAHNAIVSYKNKAKGIESLINEKSALDRLTRTFELLDIKLNDLVKFFEDGSVSFMENKDYLWSFHYINIENSSPQLRKGFHL